MYAKVDEYGFLITPYRKVENGKLTEEVEWLRADEESNAYVAPADTPIEQRQACAKTACSPAIAATSCWVDAEPGQVHRRGAEPDGRRFGRA